MTDPTSDAPAMDEFAQTRGGDDLFDDEIVPVPAVEQQPEPEVHTEPAPAPVVESDAPPPARTDTPSSRSRGGERRGRGRGRGRGGRGSHNGGRRGDGAVKNKPVESAPEPENKNGEGSTPESPAEGDQNGKEETTASDPKQAAAAEGPRVPAVRGDRSATGGLKKVGASTISRCMLANSLLAETYRRRTVPSYCCRQRKRCQSCRCTCSS